MVNTMLKSAHSLTILVTLLIWGLVPQVVMSADKPPINIFWSDLGINQWQLEASLGNDFSKFHRVKKETIIVTERKGQILIPMPSDALLPGNEEEWQMLSSKIYDVLKSRMTDALASGIKEFEIRTEQNINTGGYFNPVRQGNVLKFIQSFCLALDRLKTELSSKYNVTVNGLWGSNGGYVASIIIPELGPGLVDGGILVDPRAWESDVKRLYNTLGENLAIINTAGDAPTRNRTFPVPVFRLNEKMVAYHDTAKALKKELPRLKVYWVDCAGLDIFITQHLGAMRSNSSLLVKEFIGEEYGTISKMTGGGLRNYILGSFKTSNKKNLKKALSYPSTVPKREREELGKLGDFPPGPPPPPPVIEPLPGDTAPYTPLGDGDGNNRGGVYMAPEPESAGKGGSEMRDQVLKSRPSNDSLSWPVQLPVQEK